jgi:hypothetical protein
MKIVGCDLHTRYQQIAMLDQETGDLVERRLEHASGDARAFYAGDGLPTSLFIKPEGAGRPCFVFWANSRRDEIGRDGQI